MPDDYRWSIQSSGLHGAGSRWHEDTKTAWCRTISRLNDHYPLVIIGAGPAGLAAATVAAQHGLEVAVLDEQAMPGGQIYRAIESVPESQSQQLGGDYQRGGQLVTEFRASGAHYFSRTSVWSLNQQREIGLNQNDECRVITADRVLLATGAMERPVPFHGWTLPGVMNAGAGQILFKQNGLLPEDGLVLAGSGPLLLLLGWQYLHAGVKIAALLDTTPYTNLLHALPHLPRALLAHHFITRGLGYQQDLKRAGVPLIKAVTDLKAVGDSYLQAVNYTAGGKIKTIKTHHLMVHFGVIPNSQLSRAAGCKHAWNTSQKNLSPVVDRWSNSSIEGIQIVGDGASIGGARTAEHAGRIAAFQVLHSLGLFDRQQRDLVARADQKWMRDDLHIRPFLEKLFRPPAKLLGRPDNETTICRCEEVSAAEIRKEIASDHSQSNQIKFQTRSGMGPCQGRQCSQSVAHIVTTETGQSVTADSLYKVRPPVKPLSLGQLASLYPEESE